MTILLTTVLGTTLHVVLSRQDHMSRSLNNLTDFVETILPHVVRASWQVNEGHLAIILESIARQPGVVFAEFSDQHIAYRAVSPDINAQTGEAEAQGCSNTLTHDISQMDVGGQMLGSGLLIVCFDQNLVDVTRLFSQGRYLLVQIASIFFAAMFIALMSQKRISEPLSRLVEHLNQNQPIETFDRYQNTPQLAYDEIDELIDELCERTKQLQREQQLVEIFIPEIRDAIALTDVNLAVERANEVCTSLLTDDGGTLRVDAFFEDPRVLEEGIHDSVSGKNGRMYEVQTVRLKGDDAAGYLFVIRDQTEQIERERKAVQKSKLSVLGTLSSGVAHDFNNLLAGILSSTELLVEEVPQNPKAREFLDTIIDCAERGASLSRQLLTFAHEKNQTVTVVSAAQAAQSLINIATPLIDKSVSLNCEINTTASVEIDRGLLGSALLNLVINARDAVDGRKNAQIDVLVRDEERDGIQFIVFEIRDNGIGIPKESLDKIHDPFFTTKGRGQGSGLGLSLVLGFAQQAGGFLDVKSTEGEGTSFFVGLPTYLGEADPAHSADVVQTSLTEQIDQGTRDILIIEDERPLREAMTLILKRSGHRVSYADSMRSLKKSGIVHEHFDLIVCDLNLLDTTALDIVHYFRENGNLSKFALISGNFPQEVMRKLQAFGQFPFLEKPFRHKVFTEFVQDCLQNEPNQALCRPPAVTAKQRNYGTG